MPTLRKLLDFYIHSSLHVGLAVFCLLRLSFPLLTSYSFLVFFGTVLAYNFLKYSECLLSNKRVRFNTAGILSVSILSAVAVLLLFLKQNSSTQLHLVLALSFVLVYPLLRKVGWLKLFFVSFVVSYITVFIPLKTAEEASLLLLQRFLILSSLMVPFEISDATTDSISLQTLPQLLGIKRTKKIGYAMVGLFCLSTFYTTTPVWLPLICASSSLAAIYFSSKNKSSYYSSFWVESIPIAWWLVSLFLL